MYFHITIITIIIIIIIVVIVVIIVVIVVIVIVIIHNQQPGLQSQSIVQVIQVVQVTMQTVLITRPATLCTKTSKQKLLATEHGMRKTAMMSILNMFWNDNWVPQECHVQLLCKEWSRQKVQAHISIHYAFVSKKGRQSSGSSSPRPLNKLPLRRHTTY